MAFQAFIILIVLAISVEYLIEILKQAFPIINTDLYGVDSERVLAIILGGVMTIGARINFFALLGVDYLPVFVGYLFSAIIIAGGSGQLHDFIKAIIAIGEKYRETEPS